METQFTVEFSGDAPDPLQPGDELVIHGRVTVQSVGAEIIDVTSIGADGVEVLPGQRYADLFANRLEVWAARPGGGAGGRAS